MNLLLCRLLFQIVVFVLIKILDLIIALLIFFIFNHNVEKLLLAIIVRRWVHGQKVLLPLWFLDWIFLIFKTLSGVFGFKSRQLRSIIIDFLHFILDYVLHLLNILITFRCDAWNTQRPPILTVHFNKLAAVYFGLQSRVYRIHQIFLNWLNLQVVLLL